MKITVADGFMFDVFARLFAGRTTGKVLFDEPFGALDAQIRTTLRREIRTLLKKINVPSIFITHDQEEALELSDRIAVLNRGRLEQIGTPFDVYNLPATEYVATSVGVANLLLGVVRGRNFEIENISIELEDEKKFREGQSVKLVSFYLTLPIFSFNESSRFCASTVSADLGNFLIYNKLHCLLLIFILS